MLATVIGPRLGFVDRPDDPLLKAHTRPAVPLGGVGAFLGVHAGMAAAGIFDPGLAYATGGLLLMGLLDDRVRLSPQIRLGGEAVAGIVLVVLAEGGWSAQPLSLVLGVALVVGLVNAVNLFDGLDGLVGACAVVAGLGVAGIAEVRGLNGIFGVILAAALIGFLLLNWHPARVFLGDNGSYTVGAFLAYGIIRMSPEPIDSRVAVAAVIVGVFGLDLIATIIRRRMAGRPLFAGDRSHIYDQLYDRGWGARRVATTLALVQLGYVAVALGIESVRNGVARLALVAAVAAVSLFVIRAAGFLRTEPE
jgi:UDP-GlcNAc:undecaprenyl-phosphate GlcNAc-1-phosphate transferase